MKICEYPAIAENLRPVLSLVAEEMTSCGTQTRLRQKLFIILEELFNNSAMHAYADQPTPGPVRVTLACEPDSVSLLIEDRGMPFNPLKDVDETRRVHNLETLTSGGAGIHLVRSLSSSIEYTRENGWNRISVLVDS